jgi:hypothetical protein
MRIQKKSCPSRVFAECENSFITHFGESQKPFQIRRRMKIGNAPNTIAEIALNYN